MREQNGNPEVKHDAIRCPNCGSNQVETHRDKDSFMYGTGTSAVELSAIVPFRECRACNFAFTDSAAEDARHDAICRHLYVMTPSEVSAIRHHYGSTRALFSAKTRIGEASLARWETGQLIQNPANDDYLYLLSFPNNMERLEWRRSCERLTAVEQMTDQVPSKFRELLERFSTPEQRVFLRRKGAAACT
jgi:DNA-binding transcriptional regulator YiaG